MFGGLQSYS
jgi:hypothetical protein